MKESKSGSIPILIVAAPTISDADNEIRNAIAERIKMNREGKLLSVKAVAEAVGMKRTALTHIETGRNNASALLLWKLSCVLGCKISDFFPKTPDGFELSKLDLRKLENEDEKVTDWAKRCFSNIKKV